MPVGLCLAMALLQAAPADASSCKVRSRSEAVVVMVCTGGFDAPAVQAAAAEACGSRQACNVWIWDAESRAPVQAPKSDAELDKSKAAQAIAVWANDSKSLMRIRSAPATK